jgi:Fanconi anemia group M protein
MVIYSTPSSALEHSKVCTLCDFGLLQFNNNLYSYLKPLVAQQIEACYNIMGIPQEDTAEMTGNVAVSLREKAWKQKRVFFLTPQVMSNDLSRGLFPANHVKLLVVDEAHRAQGDYAYCLVVRELLNSR